MKSFQLVFLTLFCIENSMQSFTFSQTVYKPIYTKLLDTKYRSRYPSVPLDHIKRRLTKTPPSTRSLAKKVSVARHEVNIAQMEQAIHRNKVEPHRANLPKKALTNRKPKKANKVRALHKLKTQKQVPVPHKKKASVIKSKNTKARVLKQKPKTKKIEEQKSNGVMMGINTGAMIRKLVLDSTGDKTKKDEPIKDKQKDETKADNEELSPESKKLGNALLKAIMKKAAMNKEKEETEAKAKSDADAVNKPPVTPVVKPVPDKPVIPQEPSDTKYSEQQDKEIPAYDKTKVAGQEEEMKPLGEVNQQPTKDKTSTAPDSNNNGKNNYDLDHNGLVHVESVQVTKEEAAGVKKSLYEALASLIIIRKEQEKKKEEDNEKLMQQNLLKTHPMTDEEKIAERVSNCQAKCIEEAGTVITSESTWKNNQNIRQMVFKSILVQMDNKKKSEEDTKNKDDENITNAQMKVMYNQKEGKKEDSTVLGSRSAPGQAPADAPGATPGKNSNRLFTAILMTLMVLIM